VHPAFTGLDIVVLVAYVVGVTAFGTLLGGRQSGSRDYFLAGRSVPWWAICFSIVATETSALTFISIPATSYRTDFWFLQLAAGYLIGRVIIAWVLLPRYFSGELVTAYQLLEQRFGGGTRRFASVIFLVTRAFADSVRIFAAAIPVTLITGLAYWQSIVLAGVVTLVYTYYGGLRAVIWIDVVQMGLYVFGGIIAIYVLSQLVPGGWSEIVATAAAADKMRVVHLEGGFASGQWLLTGLVGGAFLSMASHGVDHLIVQRLLAAPSLQGARRALVGSGLLVIAQFALFLVVGLGLYAYYGGQAFDVPDEIFPRFIVEGLPPGLSGLIVAGILAAMMSTVSSSLNSLASATTHDLYAPLARAEHDEEGLMRAGRIFTIAWAVVLIGGALLFQLVRPGTPIVVIALQIASFTYGGLLGGFLLAVLSKRADQKDAIIAIGTAIVVMTILWAAQQFQLAGFAERRIDGLWFSLIGSLVTLVVGLVSAAVRGSGRDAPGVSGRPEPAGR
jgi:solute:Na+ symporter, SSS family